ncbi:hypothetical protein Sste5344_007513 [Sporothrix stenoceras]
METSEGDTSLESVGNGIVIGQYTNCEEIGEGVSSKVYVSGTVALKVRKEPEDLPPHNIGREARIMETLGTRRDNNGGLTRCIHLESYFDSPLGPVLVMPFMPLTLEMVLKDDTHDCSPHSKLSQKRLFHIFEQVFSGLEYVHSFGIIHRDIKPSSILLSSLDGSAVLSDFGASWHPEFSLMVEPVEPETQKCLDVGTGRYRAPETLFGNHAYGTSLDMWSAGAMLAECARPYPHDPLFRSLAAHEDGNQLGLILDIIKKLGTPTHETWPESTTFRTPPFEMYNHFETRPWAEILADVNERIQVIVSKLVRYQSTERLTATQALEEIQKLQNPTEEETHDEEDNE